MADALTHLAVPCLALVLSLPVFGGAAALGTLASLFSTSGPAGQ